MSEGYYVIRTFEAGAVGEKTKFFVPGKKPDGELSRRQKNAIRKQEQNEYSAQKTLARLINANFGGEGAGDLIGLDYSDKGLKKIKAWGRAHGLDVDSKEEDVQRDAVWEAASHELDIALRRLKRKLEKLGIELKAIYCTSDMDWDGKEWKKARVHHHVIVAPGTRKAFVEAWEKYGLGTVNYKQLWDNQLDRTPLAKYIIDQVRRIPDAKKFRSTRNLKRPVPKTRVVYTDNELQVPRGGKLIFRQEICNSLGERNEYRNNQSQYIRYILPKALLKQTPKEG